MKIYIFLSLMVLLLFISNNTSAQQINGEIVHQEDNITVIKVWGTHQERGYAYGYLGGERILHLFKNQEIFCC